MSNSKIDLSHLTVCDEDDSIESITVRDDADHLCAFDHSSSKDPYVNVYVSKDDIAEPETLPSGYIGLIAVASADKGTELITSGEITDLSDKIRVGTECHQFRVEPLD